MSNKKIWFITGAGRGMGADFAKAALAAGYAVVATGRNSDAVSKALGQSNDLLSRRAGCHEPYRCRSSGARRCRPVRSDRCAGQQCGQLLCGLLRGVDAGAVRAAVVGEPDRADECHPGSAAGDAQAALGPHHLDFLVGGPCRRLRLRVRLRRVEVRPEGWMESLHAEVAPFGITTTVVNPGFFRTELLTEQSTNYAEPSIADYDERRGPRLEYWKSQNGKQSGDPAKLARALITIASQEPPPRRFIAGADAIATAERRSLISRGRSRRTAPSRGRSLSTISSRGRQSIALQRSAVRMLPSTGHTTALTPPELPARAAFSRRPRTRFASSGSLNMKAAVR